MSKPTRIVLASLSTALVAAAVLLASYLFRREVDDNPTLGLITTKYLWGKPVLVTADTNRDGTLDYRMRFPPLSRSLSPHDVPLEDWQSTQCDGTYDVHRVYHPDGSVVLMEVDTNRDGAYDKRLTGEEAVAFGEELSGICPDS